MRPLSDYPEVRRLAYKIDKAERLARELKEVLEEIGDPHFKKRLIEKVQEEAEK